MIHVIATIDVNAGRRDDFLAEFRHLVPQVRAEAGCIQYGPSVDVDSGISAQKAVRDNAVVVVEQWESLEALQTHLVAPHMQEYRTKVKDLVAGMDLQILQSID